MTNPAHSDKMPHLKLVYSSTLTGAQETELIEYVNWVDGMFGLASPQGAMLERMIDGLYGIDFASDPEWYLINSLDRIARLRIVHRAMCSIGTRARTLNQSYVIARKPAYVEAQFGRWHAGIALSIAPDLDALIDACRDVSLGTPEEKKAARRLLGPLRRDTTILYNRACMSYVAALSQARKELVRPVVPTPPRLVPHVCRSSTIYPCECGAGR